MLLTAPRKTSENSSFRRKRSRIILSGNREKLLFNILERKIQKNGGGNARMPAKKKKGKAAKKAAK